MSIPPKTKTIITAHKAKQAKVKARRTVFKPADASEALKSNVHTPK